MTSLGLTRASGAMARATTWQIPSLSRVRPTPTPNLIATLGPTFAGLVADWLDDAATGEDWLDAQLAPGLMPYVPRLPDWTPLALARHVLGEVFAKAQPATTPQAHVTGAGVEFAQGGQLPLTPRGADVTTAWLSGGEVAP